MFFRLLASTGVQSMTDQFVAVVPLRTAQIVLLPGVAQFGGQRLFIAAAHYRWKEGEQVQVVLDLRRPSKPQARVAGCHPVLDAQVKDWATKTDGETSLGLLPANHGGKQERAVWGVIGENGSVDPARPLFAKVMTPFAGRPGEPSNGLYVTHKEKDPVTVLVAHGQTPTILGQAQRAHAAFEKVGVALNAQSILLSVSPPGTATADADAVHLAKGVITAGASQKVELMRNVVIEPERSTVAGEMHAQKKVQIDGEVVTGKDVSVGGNLKVEKNLEAGGA